VLVAIGGDRLDGLTLSDRIDAVVLHPLLGPLILAVVLFLVFQAVFAWAQMPMDAIKAGVDGLRRLASMLGCPRVCSRVCSSTACSPASAACLVFLPQILILFFFILILEDSGYLAARRIPARSHHGQRRPLGTRIHSAVVELRLRHSGHHGDAHDPKSARPLGDDHDRAADDLFGATAGLCLDHRRIHTARRLWGGIEQQGLVLFVLYVAVSRAPWPSPMCSSARGRGARFQTLMLELPAYHWPNMRNLLIGLWQRVEIFLTRVGTIILALMVILWALSSFPAPPPGASGPAIQYSIAGHLGAALAVLFAPIGFNWQISIALVPGLAAREVAVGALGTVYALSATGDDVSNALDAADRAFLELCRRRCRCSPGTCLRRSASRRSRP
jgi:ferrous iron transport protein B